jgi:hypothetical protein
MNEDQQCKAMLTERCPDTAHAVTPAAHPEGTEPKRKEDIRATEKGNAISELIRTTRTRFRCKETVVGRAHNGT